MNRVTIGLFVVFALLGMICGLALSALIQPGSVSAQAQSPTVVAASKAGGSNFVTPENVGIQSSNPVTEIKGNACLTTAGAATSADSPASRTFTYQGVLRLGGQVVNAVCDFQFAPWDAETGGTGLGNPQYFTTAVSSGLFTVKLSAAAGNFFPFAFDGRAIWLETAVRCPSGSGAYTTLSPRQLLTPVPLTSGLVPNAILQSDDTGLGNAALNIRSPKNIWQIQVGLAVHAGDPSSTVSTSHSLGVWGDSSTGYGVWGTTDTGSRVVRLTDGTGSAIHVTTQSTGLAGLFEGDVNVAGKLTSRMSVTKVINLKGAIPTNPFQVTSHGGTLVIFYSGSAYSGSDNKFIGISLLIDGNLIDQTGIFANKASTHLAFVPKQRVTTIVCARSHSLSLEALNADTLSDDGDIFFAEVMEMPY